MLKKVVHVGALLVVVQGLTVPCNSIGEGRLFFDRRSARNALLMDLPAETALQDYDYEPAIKSRIEYYDGRPTIAPSQ